MMLVILFSLISGAVAHYTGGIGGLCHEYQTCQPGLKCEDDECVLEEETRPSPMDGTKLCGYLAGMPTYACFDGDVCDQPSSESYGMCKPYSLEPVLGKSTLKLREWYSADKLGWSPSLPTIPEVAAAPRADGLKLREWYSADKLGWSPSLPTIPEEADAPQADGDGMGHGFPIGTILIPEGGQCGGAQDPHSMKRRCQPPLTCQFTHGVNPGGFGTCQQPVLGEHKSTTTGHLLLGEHRSTTTGHLLAGAPAGYGAVGHGPIRPHPIGTILIPLHGQCGGPPDPDSMKRRCQGLLTCQFTNPNPGGFGTCERLPKEHILSNVGGHCGNGDSPRMASYKCAYGLWCSPPPHGVRGSYGTCVLANWIPQEPGMHITVYEHHFCGHHGRGPIFVCDANSGLTCQHGICQQTWSPPPVIHSYHTSPKGGICGTASGTGTYTCQRGLYCLGYVPDSDVYGSCQPYRRLEALGDAPELEAPLDELEAPLDD